MDEKLIDFNFTEVLFPAQDHGDIYIVDSIQFTDFNFTILPLTVKLQN